MWKRNAGAGTSSSFATDKPITSAKEDLLGRLEFSRALATVLYNHRANDSLVVALRGEWGSGKTSIKNIVVEILRSRDDRPMQVVEFNPWQWGGDEAITRAFFQEIAVALGDADKSLRGRRRAYEFRQYAQILDQFSSGLRSVAHRSPSIVGWLVWLSLLVVGTGLFTPDLKAQQLAATLLVARAVLPRVESGSLGLERRGAV